MGCEGMAIVDRVWAGTWVRLQWVITGSPLVCVFGDEYRLENRDQTSPAPFGHFKVQILAAFAGEICIDRVG